ncbi:MAG: hypothetical protein V4772_26470 [Pseudomonadota bacterium]
MAPRKDFARHFEGLPVSSQGLNRALHARLEEMFHWPAKATNQNPSSTDLAIDILVQSYSKGGFADLSLDVLPAPLLWRPKVCIAARIYHLQSGHKKAEVVVTQKMPWREYFGMLTNWKVFAGFAQPANRARLEQLLVLACQRLVTRVENAI